MKKFTLPLIAILIFTSAHSQINKGSLLIGGNLSAGIGNYESSDSYSTSHHKTHGFKISPSLGIAVRNNTIIGAGLTFGQTRDEYSDISLAKSNTYGGLVYIRKYLTLGKNFYFLGQTSAYFNQDKSEEKQGSLLNRISKTLRTGISLYPGVAYQVNRRLQLEIGLNDLVNLGYQRSNIHVSDISGLQDQKQESFGFSTNVSSYSPVIVGFRFLLAK